MSTKSSLQSLLTHALARSLTSLDLTACRLKMPYTALCGIPMRLKMSGALIPVLLRAITLQRCRIVLRGFLWQYQYYCMFCLIKHIVGSNLKSKNQEVSGFSDQWVLNVKVDFNEISHECLPTLQFESTKFSRNLKKSKFENFHIKKSTITFAQGCNEISLYWLQKKGGGANHNMMNKLLLFFSHVVQWLTHSHGELFYYIMKELWSGVLISRWKLTPTKHEIWSHR